MPNSITEFKVDMKLGGPAVNGPQLKVDLNIPSELLINTDFAFERLNLTFKIYDYYNLTQPKI